MNQTDSSTKPTPILVALVLAIALLASACGGSDAGDPPIETSSSNVADSGETSSAESESEPATEPEASRQSARVTLSTGEVFDMIPRSCETQATNPNSLLNDNFHDLSARTADGEVSFQVLNATSAESEPIWGTYELEAERDENDVNPRVSYINSNEGDGPASVTIDGARVTGEAVLSSKFSSTKPYGESVTATFEFNC